jgi:glycosyltransferase involved in cell wall biosynthesis
MSINKNLVVIFCFNVEKNLEQLIRASQNKVYSDFDFLFIEDKSTDNTKKILDYYKKYIETIYNNKNEGFGVNYKKSIKYAIKKKYKTIIFLHGDNQYSINYILKIKKYLNFYDLCYGSRRILFNSMKKNMPYLRFSFNILLTNLINFTLKNKASEYFSGLRGIKIDKLQKINLEKFSNFWSIEQEIHFYFIKKKHKIKEFPIKTVYKESHKSYLPPFKYVLYILFYLFYYKIKAD